MNNWTYALVFDRKLQPYTFYDMDEARAFVGGLWRNTTNTVHEILYVACCENVWYIM